MGPRPRLYPAGLLFSALSLALLAVACEGAPSAQDPKTPQAEHVANLAWFLFASGTAVFVAVMALFAVALFHRRRRARVEFRPSQGHGLIVMGGIVVPAVILAFIMAITVYVGSLLMEPAEGDDALTVVIVGRMFWWEVIYPELGIVTANEIHIPAGRLIRLDLTSADVIHSFWVPQVGGKLDLMPGTVNTLWLEARDTGTFRGQCAEFCGIQHTRMALHWVVDPPDEFDLWAAAMVQEPAPPATDMERRGLAVFMAQGCSVCHAVRGTEARGVGGPDLTKLRQRLYIAAGTLPNTRENVLGFITDAQRIKRGSFMPSFEAVLTEEELEALIAYLETLQ